MRPEILFLRRLALAGAMTLPLAVGPTRSQAQNLYVASFGNFTVSEYDAGTGAAVRSPLVSSADGVADPEGVAISGHTLYVANVGPGTVTAYDAATGAAAAGFTTISTGGGMTPPSDVQAANGLLYVSINGANTVNAYNALTGAPASGFTAITGLSNPAGLALLGTTLYVSDQGAGTIRTYDALTGALLNPSFLSGFTGANFLTVAGATLYVSDVGANVVSAYDALTGAPANGFTPIPDPNRPEGVQVLGNTLYVANYGDGNPGTGSVAEYDAATGMLLDAGFITGQDETEGLALSDVPEPAPWALLGLGGAGLLASALRRSHRCARRA